MHADVSSLHTIVPSGFSSVVILSQEPGLLFEHSSRHEAIVLGDDAVGTLPVKQIYLVSSIKGVELILALHTFSLNPIH